MFCDGEGKSLKSFRKAYDRLLKRAGVADATIHTMRHTYASYLVMNGSGLKVVQELLGHHSVRVTERYAHLNDGFKAEAVARLKFG